MSLALSIYYRGPLSGCNYDCAYCPFAKTRDDRESLRRDAAALERFVGWVRGRTEDRLGILFTPWGEALIHEHYRQAMIALSRLAQVRRVAIQTNLSMSVSWLAEADRARLALWCTYHPSQVRRATFLERCRGLDELGIRYSVGMVGLPDDLDEIEAMRQALPERVYLWVNANKSGGSVSDPSRDRRLEAVDPLYALNARRHPSRGLPCAAGERSISVDGEGRVRRCHFVAEPIGNLYDGSFPGCLRPRRCPEASCGCYIGYAQLEPLRLEAIYGEGLLERIPLPHALDAAAARRALEGMDEAWRSEGGHGGGWRGPMLSTGVVGGSS